MWGKSFNVEALLEEGRPPEDPRETGVLFASGQGARAHSSHASKHLGNGLIPHPLRGKIALEILRESGLLSFYLTNC